MADEKAKLQAFLTKHREEYTRLLDPTTMLAFKASLLDKVWDIFGGNVIKPETASFTIGRLFEAMVPYGDAVRMMKAFEVTEKKLGDMERGADQKNAAQGV